MCENTYVCQKHYQDINKDFPDKLEWTAIK